jgi:hypothetical protein
MHFFTVNHLDYLGVQVAWVTGPWFLSIFMNMLPWESGKLRFALFETFTLFFSKHVLCSCNISWVFLELPL